jgi:hypothetical protein
MFWLYLTMGQQGQALKKKKAVIKVDQPLPLTV